MPCPDILLVEFRCIGGPNDLLKLTNKPKIVKINQIVPPKEDLITLLEKTLGDLCVSMMPIT